MSASEASERLRAVVRRLETRVTEALGELGSARAELERERERRAELENLLRRFDAGEEDPATFADRMHRLEARNRELEERMERGREAAERLLARIRFVDQNV